MTEQQYEERQEQECRARWFPEHVAMFQNLINPRPGEPAKPTLEIKVLDWRKPGTGIFAMRYIIDGGTLIVHGDAGHAIFRWSEHISWGFLAGCGLHYFAEKCEASPHGREFKRWDSEVAKTEINRIAKDFEIDGEENPLSGIDYESEAECVGWLHRHRDDLFRHRIESEVLSSIISAGQVIDANCIGMWVGVKMAAAQLQNNIPVASQH